MLVYHGAEIDVQDKYGFTPLLLNASYSNIVTTKSILEHNANPMIKNKKGKSIFDLKYHPKTINFDEMHKYSFDKDLSDPKPIRLPRILHMDIELIELISNLR